MGKVQNLREPIAGHDPLRTELASAISAATEAKRVEDAARDAVTRAAKMVEQAVVKLNAATAASERERDEQASRMVSAATTGAALAPDRSTRESRMRQVDAEDDVSAARSALAALEATVAESEEAHRHAEKRVEAAADDVMMQAVPLLLKEAEAVQADLIAKRAVLRHLASRDLIAETDLVAVRTFMRQTSLPAYFGAVEHDDWTNHPANAPWLGLREALRTNPDAALPV